MRPARPPSEPRVFSSFAGARSITLNTPARHPDCVNYHLPDRFPH